jgi:hypothetical protein
LLEEGNMIQSMTEAFKKGMTHACVSVVSAKRDFSMVGPPHEVRRSSDGGSPTYRVEISVVVEEEGYSGHIGLITATSTQIQPYAWICRREAPMTCRNLRRSWDSHPQQPQLSGTTSAYCGHDHTHARIGPPPAYPSCGQI